MDASIPPKFCRPRSVPYAMRELVDKELSRLEQEGIIEPVQFAEWAALIVPVLKEDRASVRICGDYKLTVNQAPKLDSYPIPKIKDLFATLAGGKNFSKLDMSQSYQQLPLEEESKKYVVINTQWGLYRYNRLLFGISSAPGIFQRTMENLVQGISWVVVFIDDILITGTTEHKHLVGLEEVLTRLEEAGLRLKKHHLGHRIDAEGLHPITEKVEAVQ